MPCEAVSGFPAEISMECVFSTGSAAIDTLSVYLSSTTDIAIGALKFKVKGIRGPPTTKEVDGFVIRTGVWKNTEEREIEEIDESETISIKVDEAADDNSANMVVSADF